MKLKYMEDLSRKNLSSETRNSIDNLVSKYLEDTTKESMAETIGAIYQDVKRNYECTKFTTNCENDFWDELIKFWHYAESKYFKRYMMLKGNLSFSHDYYKTAVRRMLNSIYGDILQVFRIAEHETLGGIPAVIDAMAKKMEEDAELIFVHNQIVKYFEKYRNDFYAVQYIAVKYLSGYRPDLYESPYNGFEFCKFDSRDNPHITAEGLDKILTLHLKDTR